MCVHGVYDPEPLDVLIFPSVRFDHLQHSYYVMRVLLQPQLMENSNSGLHQSAVPDRANDESGSALRLVLVTHFIEDVSQSNSVKRAFFT